ncbi:MAG: four helix bundle protein [Paludibacteraceae bacterium]|nr:four helix bundle protein [Paludibacteraceae bacterium]
METKNRFKNLMAYQESLKLVKMTYTILRSFPKEENFALSDQLRRAVVSIPSNIAEGMGRYSTKEQTHFLEIAFGSLLEISAQLDIASDLGYIVSSQQNQAEEQIDKAAALISGLRNKRTQLLSPDNNNL